MDIPFLGARTQGKMRNIYRCGDRLILVTTDRLAAFDRIPGLVPFKRQVLTRLSAFWFQQTADLIGNHPVAAPDPNVAIARTCTPLPVVVVVRSSITG